ncbi:MAG: tetratricopeptide repeat protein [Candidatus Hodarchaeota archaeon]
MSNAKIHDLEEAERLLNKGEFNAALQFVEIFEKRKNSSPHNRLKGQLLKGTLMNKLGNFAHAIELAEQILKESYEVKMHLLRTDALIIKADALWHLGNLDKSFDVINQCEQLLKSLADEQSPDFIQRIIRLTNCKGVSYWAQGNLDQALECFEQNLALGQHLNNKEEITESLHNLAAIYHTKGDLDYALEHFQKSLALSEEHGNKQLFAGTLLSIGSIYTTKGDLELALDYLGRSLKVFKELSNQQYIAVSLRNIGRIYQRKGELNQALDYLEQSLVLFKKLGNKLYSAGALFSLVSVAIDFSSLEQAQEYLKELQEISFQEDNKVINHHFRVAEALLFKTSVRARNKVKAEELLEQVVKEDVVNHEVTVVALLNLCDLLLGELRLFGDPEILDEVQNLVNRLLVIAQKQNSHFLLVETYLLQSKLALVDLNLEKSQNLLMEAQRLADEKGLGKLAIKISIEYDELLKQLNKWESFIQQQTSLNERTELANLEEYLGLMIRKSAIEVPLLPTEEAVMVLILDERGLSLFSKVFSSGSKFEDQLMGGFLMAIQSFSTQVFAQTIDRVKFEDYTLLMKAEEPFLLCYIFQGPSYYARQKLNQFVRLLQNQNTAWQALIQVIETGRTLRISDQALLEDLVMTVFTSRNEYKF